MRSSISRTVLTSLSILTISLAALGAVAPASADVANWRSGQTPSAFAMGDVSLGLAGASHAVGDFTAFYAPASGSANVCAPVVIRHQRTDTIEVPASCF